MTDLAVGTADGCIGVRKGAAGEPGCIAGAVVVGVPGDCGTGDAKGDACG